ILACVSSAKLHVGAVTTLLLSDNIEIMCSMKGDVKRKHFPADGGSWISLASRPCAMESRRSGRRLELDIHAVQRMPTEPGRMQAAGLGLPTMVLSETRGLWLCGVVREIGRAHV